MRRLAVLTVLSTQLLVGCSILPLEGDKHFQADRLEEAATAYQDYLARHEGTTAKREKAMFHLGLIHALPESPLYDVEKANKTLLALAEQNPAGTYSRQAMLIVALHLDVARLEKAVQTQASHTAQLETELSRLEEEAARASTDAGKHETRARQLTAEINQLRSEIDRLSQALEQRKHELERIKEIDLEKIP